MPHFGYQQYFAKRLSADLTAVNSYMVTEGYFEDDSGAFDSTDSGDNPNAAVDNVGYKRRKMQFAKQVPIKDHTGKVTGKVCVLLVVQKSKAELSAWAVNTMEIL